MLNLLLNEDLWFPAAILITFFAVVGLLLAKRGQPIPKATRVKSGLNLFYGVLVGIMALGHLLGITIRTVLGSLPASTQPLARVSARIHASYPGVVAGGYGPRSYEEREESPLNGSRTQPVAGSCPASSCWSSHA